MPLLPHADAGELGLDADQLRHAYHLLQQWTDGLDAAIPGAALLIGRHGKTLPPQWFGKQSPDPDAAKIRSDAIFLLASLTKPITYLAAMTLVEQGKLVLSESVMHYIPEFAAHHKEEIRVLHLFTHTSGMPDMLKNNVELRRQHAPLSRFIDGAIRDTVPAFPAGTQLQYQSMGTLIVAEIVQRLTGKSIREFLADTLFRPLQLSSTALGSSGLDESRIVGVQIPDYQQGSDFDWNGRYWRELGSPWGGMFSTPAEYAVLCQLMLDGGTHGGQRVVSPRTVEMITTNRLDDLPLPESVRRTQPWGLGWQLNHLGTSSSWSDLLGRHVFGHTGATGTLVWIDPRADAFCLLFTSGIMARQRRKFVQVSNVVASAIR